MKIVMVASEMAPYSKTGGLADAVGGLSKELAARGHQVFCVVPYYRCSWNIARAKPTGMKLTVTVGQKQVTADILEAVQGSGFRETVQGSGRLGSRKLSEFRVQGSDRDIGSRVGQGREAGSGESGASQEAKPRTENSESFREQGREPGTGSLQVIFVRRDEYFDRSELYSTGDRDYEDNAERFIFFSKIAVEWLRVRELYADVVHCHDWQAALVPLLTRLDEQANRTRIATKTMFTIHNLAYQGIFWSLDFPMTNLPWQFFTPDGLEFYGQMNLMKAGIVFSDLLTTVSPRYAQEIQTAECGFGLENAVKARADRLRGILNGIDAEDWNPETDPHIAARFSVANLEGKAACKQDLLKRFNLDDAEESPLIGMISRLTEQKGFDIIEETLEKLLANHVRVVVLGRGESRYEKFWQDAAKRYPKRVGCRLAYDERLAHQIEAGADLFLMPSKFEPCGFNQMYSLRYGTIPIVRATGGLDDTIQQFDPQTGQGNGFKFSEYSGSALLAKCEEALRVYKDKPLWQRLQQNAMSCDFSWKQSATHYIELYEKG